MTQIYCGNNGAEPSLLSGEQILGTRYTCMQKGIGRGLHLPYDSKYTGAYVPIDNRKIYCGNKDILPTGYDFFGTLPHCIQKGVGIGKKIRAEQGPSKRRKSPKRKSKRRKSPKRKSKRR